MYFVDPTYLKILILLVSYIRNRKYRRSLRFTRDNHAEVTSIIFDYFLDLLFAISFLNYNHEVQ